MFLTLTLLMPRDRTLRSAPARAGATGRKDAASAGSANGRRSPFSPMAGPGSGCIVVFVALVVVDVEKADFFRPKILGPPTPLVGPFTAATPLAAAGSFRRRAANLRRRPLVVMSVIVFIVAR